MKHKDPPGEHMTTVRSMLDADFPSFKEGLSALNDDELLFIYLCLDHLRRPHAEEVLSQLEARGLRAGAG